MIGKVLFRTDVSTRGGTQQKFEIRTAQGVDPRKLVAIYNARLNEHDRGLAVELRHIESRLQHDPECVHVGFLAGEPVSLINVAKLQLASTANMPKSHQALTADDTFTNTDPNHGNMWFCPWVVVTDSANGFKAAIAGATRSLGQVHVLAVKEEAQKHGRVEHLFAYSRPGNLRTYLENHLGVAINFTPDPGLDLTRMITTDNRSLLLAERSGILKLPGRERIVDMQAYWGLEKEGGIKFDQTFRFHAQNGAMFCPALVMPYGNIYDGNSLSYRTPLEYPLG